MKFKNKFIQPVCRFTSGPTKDLKGRPFFGNVEVRVKEWIRYALEDESMICVWLGVDPLTFGMTLVLS